MEDKAKYVKNYKPYYYIVERISNKVLFHDKVFKNGLSFVELGNNYNSKVVVVATKDIVYSEKYNCNILLDGNS